ncbi:MAG TPA: hypothetical protein VKV32_02250, partial [Stellaceae bacterium]|nr:hypothetical protein [Stellaceae bacterium]
VADRARELIRKTPGQQLITLSAEETKAVRDKSQPVIADWLAATPDGQATLDQFNAALAAIRAGNRSEQ